MLAKILELRVNFAIVFAGALTIIFLIKMTSVLLPAKYYFNFSKLVAGSSEPFIVDPPSVTGGKLCEIMARYGITEKSFDRRISCAEKFESALTPDQIDKIYSIALRSDQALRDAFTDVLGKTPIKPLTDAELTEIVSKTPTVALAFEEIFDAYAQQLNDIAEQGPTRAIRSLYGDIGRRDRSDEIDDGQGAAKRGLPADVARRVSQAHQALVAEITGAALARKIPAIKKSSIDDIIRNVQTSGAEVGFQITHYYTTGLTSAFREAMARQFISFNLTAGKNAERKLVFDEINRFSWRDYVLSVVIRLTPVLIFGLLVGAAVGRTELTSIALAGGLAAFLLSWPLILLWDRLVQTGWSDTKPLFFSLYAVYVVSFFFTARSAALLGVWLREQRVGRLATQPAQEGVVGLRVTWGELAINLAAAIILNGVVYASNFFIPLGAGGSQ